MRYSGQSAVDNMSQNKSLTPSQSLTFHSRVLLKVDRFCVYWLQGYYSIFISGLKETLTSVRQQIGYTANYKKPSKINEVTELSQTSTFPILYTQTLHKTFSSCLSLEVR